MQGFHVIAGLRSPKRGNGLMACEIRAVDIGTALDVEAWKRLLADVDAVVNLVGIFAEGPGASFDAVQRAGPEALFAACESQGVRRFVQFSSLGADAGAREPFLRTKHQADEALLAKRIEAVVMQPSLVYGDDGASSNLFRMLATLPVAMLPDGGHQPVQPVHVDDVVSAVIAALRAPEGFKHAGRRIALVGPYPLALREYLAILRRQMGMPGTLSVVNLPLSIAMWLAKLAHRLHSRLLSEDALQMLARGNTAPAVAITELLGRAPRPPDAFMSPEMGGLLRVTAVHAWLSPVLRASLAVLWIWTAIVSVWLYPIEDSIALLARSGVPEPMRYVALYGAAALDLALGILSILPRRPQWLWRAQMALILAYTAIISVRLPEFWLHPYGPLTKNLPILALIWLVDSLERRTWTTSR